MTNMRHLTQQRQQNGHRHCHHYYYDNNAPLKKCRARRSLLLTMLTPSAILLWLSAIILCMTLTSTTSTVSATHLTEFVSVEAWRGSRSWRRLIDNCMSAYQILTQGVILNGQGLPASYESSGMLSSPSQQGRNRLAQNIVDYATSDDAHSAVDALTTPDMITLPTAAQALVVVFNLPGVTSKLTLTMNITARIFTGSITKWNDPAIKSLNPVVALPDENIILVVRGDPLPMNNVLHTAMSGISTEWKSMVIQADDILHWPSTINLITIKNQLSQSNTLSTVPYTIGYMWQDEAALAGIPFANFKSSTGAIIVPNADSVLFAVMEKGGVPLVQGESYLIDLTLPTGTTAWPMSHFSYVQMRTTAVRLTCSNKRAMLKFWFWFYTSQTAADLAAAKNFVIPPTSIRAAHKIVNTINSGMYCGTNGDLAFPAERTEQSLGYGSPQATALLQLYAPVYNNLITGSVTYTETTSDEALQRVLYGEADFALTVSGVMRKDVVTSAIDSGEVLQLPLFAVRIVTLYHIPGISGGDADGIILDWPAMSDIWMGRIDNWNDPRIAALNPTLAAAGKLPNLNITRVVASSGAREIEKIYFTILYGFSSLGPIESRYNLTTDSYDIALPWLSSAWLSSMDGILTVSEEKKVQAAVANTPGAIGIDCVTSLLDSAATKTRLMKYNGEVVKDSPTNSYRCFVDTLNATSGRVIPAISQQPGCWPLSTFIYSMVRSSNIGGECTNAPRALKFLQFLHDQSSATGETVEAAFEAATAVTDNVLEDGVSGASSTLQRISTIAEQLGALWALPSHRAFALSRLNGITCDGETILVTLPVDHRIGKEVESAMLGISILAGCVVALILCFLYFFHLRSAIKASSPLFLIATIVGMLLLFITGPLVARSAPTDRLCGSGWWLFNIGFYMTFGPLFAKSWRIYKIFMRKEMTVIKLTDASLMFRLAIGLAFEILMLGIMQSVDPVQARESIQYALPRDQTIYYCAPQRLAMASLVTGYKGIILLFGAIMSFSTRSVSENFNESKPIAFSIYNVIFTSCIIIPIALLTQSDGRTLYLLAIFGLYWITLCTLCIIFAPKVITIYKDASGLFAQRISDSKATASDISRSAQLGRTIKELSQQPIRLMDRVTLRTYVNLLEKELTMARTSLATLDANEGVLAVGSAGMPAVYAQRATKSVETSSHDTNDKAATNNGALRPAFTGSPTNRATNTSIAARPYQSNGSPRTQAREIGMMQRTTSMINKFTSAPAAHSTGSTSPPTLALTTTRSVASIAPHPNLTNYPSAGPSRANTPGFSDGKIHVSIPHSLDDTMNDSAAAASSRTMTPAAHVGIAATETRFRMPGSVSPQPTPMRHVVPAVSTASLANMSPFTVKVDTPPSSSLSTSTATTVDASLTSSTALPLPSPSQMMASQPRPSSANSDENTSLLM